MDIREFLKIEEDGELLEYRVTNYNLPLWLFIRADIIHFYLPQKLFGLQNPHIKVSPFDLTLKEKVSYLVKTTLKNPFMAKKRDIVIFGAGVNCVFDKNYYINRLYDYFWHYFKDKILLIESSNKFFYPTPRFNNEIFYSDLIPIVSRILYKFKKISEKDVETLEKFLIRLNDKFNSLFQLNLNHYIDKNKSRLLKLISKINIRILLYIKLLKLLEPKLIIIEDAHYGGYTDLIYLAKQFNIKVAEYQHGFISSNHLAYNFHPSTFLSLKEYLPDYMLFWGEFWARLSQIPGEKIIIGFPYIEEKSKNLKKEKSLLLISGGCVPDEVVDFGLKLIKIPELRDYKFIFRPHPSERPAQEKRYNILFANGYELDMGNLYETLKKVEICIGLEPSTVLFEAIAFNCKSFLKLSKSSFYIKEIKENLPFNIFESIEQLLEILNKPIPIQEKNLFFAENSIKNFKTFLDEFIYK